MIVQLGEALSWRISTFRRYSYQESGGQQCGGLLRLSVRASEFGDEKQTTVYAGTARRKARSVKPDMSDFTEMRGNGWFISEREESDPL